MLLVLGYFSGILGAASFAPYLRDIFRLKTKPEIASWLIWSILGVIAFSTQFAEGASYSLWFTGVQAAGDILIFILALRFGVGGFVRRDVIALTTAGISLVLWYVTNNPAVALYIVIFIDAIGVFLTILKAFKQPETEALSSWILNGTAGLCSSLAVGSFNIVLLSYPIYICIGNYGIALAMLAGRRAKK